MSQLEQQMRHRDKEMVPRALVQAMFALMIGSVALVGFATFTGRDKVGVVAASPVVQSLDIVFTGDRSGVYTVTDPSGAVIAISSEDRAGFIGVIGRVFQYERALSGIDMTAPVTVVRRENGKLAILDPVTDKTVDLIGYGKDNVAAFAKLLD